MRIVAEVGNAHDGSLGNAYAYIDAVADAGADAIKFQNHYEDPVFEFRPGTFFPQDLGRQGYWKRVTFACDQWAGLREHAHERGLAFGVSCFSMAAFEMMRPLKPDFWKVPSGLVTDAGYLTALAETEAPVVLSSGMSSTNELELALSALVAGRCRDVTVLQATSEYPCPPERIGLNMLAEFRRGPFHTHVGLSDHSGRPWAGLAAAALGADMLEVHVTFSRHSFGPDVPASLTIEELRMLVEGALWIDKAMQNPVDKDAIASEMDGVRAVFRQQIC